MSDYSTELKTTCRQHHPEHHLQTVLVADRNRPFDWKRCRYDFCRHHLTLGSKTKALDDNIQNNTAIGPAAHENQLTARTHSILFVKNNPPAASRIMANNKNSKPLLAVVEGGGTSFGVAVCEWRSPQEPPTILCRRQIDSDADPAVTLQQCADFFQEQKKAFGIASYAALGLATFGPVGVRAQDKETYGKILPSSPKAVWRNVDLLTPLRNACSSDTGNEDLPVLVETDVNAPALSEYWSARKQQQLQQEKENNNSNATPTPTISSTAYITVGTGIGVGLVVNGQTVHGQMHPEGGHVPIQPLPNDTFTGYSWGRDKSPFGGVATVEGIASTVALTERWLQQHEQEQNNSANKTQQQDANSAQNRAVLADLPDGHPVFEHAVNALANLCASLLLMLSMEKIVLGGGLMNRTTLLPQIQRRTAELLNGYLPLPQKQRNQNDGTTTEDDLSAIIVTSDHGKDAGLQGAITLAQHAYQQAMGMDSGIADDKEKKMKQEAFNVGLWHGAVVGALAVAAGFQLLKGTFWRKH